MVRAIIMAGGEGTRLRPLTCNRPKPMIPVLNRPVTEHAVNLLKEHGITDITMSLYYLPENLQNYFGDGSDWDVNISYSVEETPLGTAGGVKLSAGEADETVVVLSGDGIIDFDIQEILKFHREKKSLFTIVLTRVTRPTEYGIVITREDGQIEKFLEKPSWSEVFSDTANTGMYIIEPEIINQHIPGGIKYDFSMDLFPALQKKEIPLYGYISDGYWCDVGNLTSYTDVHHDLLDGMVNLPIPGKQIRRGIWVGRDVDIHPEAKLEAPVFLGDFVKIKQGAEVSEFSVIGDNCVIEDDASIRRSVILHSTIIGPRCELRGAVLGKRCVLEEGVSIYEGAVISDDCSIGNGVSIPSGLRVWPDKTIEQGTRLTSDLIWGQMEKKTLFSNDGIVGTFNVKINPEFAAKLGAALGAFLGKNSQVVLSRDTSAAARIIKRALTAGFLSMGVDVFDMEIESVPVNRYSVRFTGADMGVYVQISPLTGLQFIQIKIFNKHGFQIPLKDEKKIENIFFRGDYPRKDAFETGKLFYPSHHVESYITNSFNYVDLDLIKAANHKVIVDCFNGTASYIFPELLDEYGCDTTVLRGQMKEYVTDEDIKTSTRKAINHVIEMATINKEIGVILGPHASQLTVVDETGSILSRDDISAILSLFYIKNRETKTIYFPVTTSMALENMLRAEGCEVKRISSKLRAPEGSIDVFRIDESGCYPYLQQDNDPMLTFLLILEYLSLEKKPLFEIKEALPKTNIIETTLPCTTEEKASIMRMITSDVESDKMELSDGIKIHDNKAWILILPDAIHPVIHLFAEGDTVNDRDDILDFYHRRIKQYKASLSGVL